MNGKTPEELGFAPGVPGHRISYVGPWNPQYASRDHKFACSCGMEIHARETVKGVGLRSVRTWKDHIDAVSVDPDMVFEVGTVVKPRVTWVVKVIHRENQYAQSYASGTYWYKNWADKNDPQYAVYAGLPWAVVIDKSTKTTNNKVLATICASQRDAVKSAMNILVREEERDFAVTYAAGPVAPPVATIVPTFRNTFSELLERTDAAVTGDLNDVEETMKELDEVLGLIPVLQARREELASIWESRTVGLLSK